jgi:hypothetical protein
VLGNKRVGRVNGSLEMSSQAVTLHDPKHDPKSLSSLFQRVWPSMLIILGLVATAAWTGALLYGAVALVEMAL